MTTNVRQKMFLEFFLQRYIFLGDEETGETVRGQTTCPKANQVTMEQGFGHELVPLLYKKDNLLLDDEGTVKLRDVEEN